MAIIEIAKIQVRRGQESLTGVPQLAAGEFGWAQDTENLYIGKRIAEGANTDENSRILTQKDYDNLFAIVMGAGRTAVASTSTYRYRDNLAYSVLASTTTFIGLKLDGAVSLTDFGVTSSSTATDISPQLSQAIYNLFNNPLLGDDARRQLKIPAGIYYLDETIDLPPHTYLTGEGPGMTTLISKKNDRPLFRTVDAQGNTFEETMQSSTLKSKDVVLENMTLAYSGSTSTPAALVFFDNTEESKIRNVEFTCLSVYNTTTGPSLLVSSVFTTTQFSLTTATITATTTGTVGSTVVIMTAGPHDLQTYDFIKIYSTSTITNGTVLQELNDQTFYVGYVTSANQFPIFLDKFLQYPVITTSSAFTATLADAVYKNDIVRFGTGVSLRGERRSGVEQNQHVSITDCKFNNLKLAVLGTGTVAYSRIENTVFSELEEGIRFEAFNGDVNRLAPTDAVITKNSFKNILNNAIYVGTSTRVTTFTPNILNHVSSFNSFYRCGNGKDLGDGISSNTGTAIITNLGEGFTSQNDRFSRKEFSNPNLNPRSTEINFFYKPLVEGNVFVDGGQTSIVGNLTYGKQVIDRLYAGEGRVTYKIPYTLSDGSNLYTRSGLLTVNIVGSQNYFQTPAGSLSDYYDFNYDDTWPPTTVDGAYDDTGDLIQPVITLETGGNNSHLNLIYEWPINPPAAQTTFRGTITNISNANPAVVTTRESHNLNSGTQVLLTNVQGMNNFFATNNQLEFYVGLVTTNTFQLFYDFSLISPVDTTSLPVFVSTTTLFSTSTAVVNTVTNTTPPVVTTLATHGLVTGDFIRLSILTTSTSSTIIPAVTDGLYYVNAVSSNSFELWLNEARTTPFNGGLYTGFVGTATGTIRLNTRPSVVTVTNDSSLTIRYQTNIIS